MNWKFVWNRVFEWKRLISGHFSFSGTDLICYFSFPMIALLPCQFCHKISDTSHFQATTRSIRTIAFVHSSYGKIAILLNCKWHLKCRQPRKKCGAFEFYCLVCLQSRCRCCLISISLSYSLWSAFPVKKTVVVINWLQVFTRNYSPIVFFSGTSYGIVRARGFIESWKV